MGNYTIPYLPCKVGKELIVCRRIRIRQQVPGSLSFTVRTGFDFNKNTVRINKSYDVSFDVDEISSIAVEDDIIVVEDEDEIADTEVIAPEITGAGETSLAAQIIYEEYKRMTPLEKAQSCGFTRLRNYDAVEGVVKLKLMELGHKPSVDELMEET